MACRWLPRADGLVAGVCYGLGAALAIGGWRSLGWAEAVETWETEGPDYICACRSKTAFPPSPLGSLELEKGLYWILPGAGMSFVALHTALLVTKGVRCCMADRCRFRTAHALRAACHWLMAARARQDAFQERVAMEVQRMRVSIVRALLTVGAPVCMAAIVATLHGYGALHWYRPEEPDVLPEPYFTTNISRPVWDDEWGVDDVSTDFSSPVPGEDRGARDLIVESSYFGLVMFYFLVVILQVLPLTVRTLDGVSVLIEAAWTFRVCVAPTEASDDTVLRVVFFSSTLLCGNARLHTVLKLVSYGTEMVARRCHGTSGTSLAEDVQIYLLSAANRIIIFWALEWLQWSQATATVRALQADRGSMLVQRILAGMCDAVVQLGDRLQVARPCPKLGALLMSGLTMLEHPLAALLHEEDRQPFAQHMASEAEYAKAAQSASLDPLPAHALHVRMRDCNGSYVRVELFCTCIPDALTGHPRYLVGVKEEAFADQRELPDHEGLALPAGVGRCPIPEADAWASSASTNPTPTLPSEPDAEPCVWVDAETEGLRVVRHNREFAALIGPHADGLQLLPWFADQRGFRSFVQRGAEALLRGREAAPRLAGARLCPPRLAAFGVRLTTTVLLSLPGEGELESPAAAQGQQILQLSLQDVEATTSKRRKEPSGRGTPVTPEVSGTLGTARGQARAGHPGATNGVEGDSVVVWFRPMEGFRVLSCSAGLCALGVLPRGARLLKYLEEGGPELEAATNDLTNSLLNESEVEVGGEDVRTARLGAVRLRLLGAGAVVSCEACTLAVRLRVRRGSSEDSMDEELTARLVLDGVAMAGHDERSHPHASSSGSGGQPTGQNCQGQTLRPSVIGRVEHWPCVL